MAHPTECACVPRPTAQGHGPLREDLSGAELTFSVPRPFIREKLSFVNACWVQLTRATTPQQARIHEVRQARRLEDKWFTRRADTESQTPVCNRTSHRRCKGMVVGSNKMRSGTHEHTRDGASTVFEQSENFATAARLISR